MSMRKVPLGVEAQELRDACSRCSLAHLCLPYGLDADGIAELEAEISTSRPVAANRSIYDQGDSPVALYAVSRGSFKTRVLDDEGLEQVVGFHFAGGLLGLDGFGDNQHHCTATALETSTVCRLPLNCLDDLMTRLPALRRQLMRLMGQTLSDDEQQLLTLGRKNSEARIATFLQNLAERDAMRGTNTWTIDLTMKRADLANFLGMRIETVSRVMQQLQSDRVIDGTRRRVTVLDTRELATRAGIPASVADQ